MTIGGLVKYLYFLNLLEMEPNKELVHLFETLNVNLTNTVWIQKGINCDI